MKDLPHNWKMRPIGEIVASIDGGISLAALDRSAAPGEHGVLTLSAVSYGHFTPEANKAVLNGSASKLGRSVRAGTVLISRSNTAELVGACAFIEATFPHLHLPDLIWAVSLDEDRFDPQWFHYALSSPHCRAQIQSRATGTSGSMKKLSMSTLRTIEIPVPLIGEQHEIARVLRNWDRGIRQLSVLIAAKVRFKQGLVQQLLSGELRYSRFAKGQIVPTPLHEVFEKAGDPIKVDSEAKYREIGIRSHGKGIFHKEPVPGALLGNKRVYAVIPDCLTLNIVFAWERALAVTTDNEAGMSASHRFPMFRPNKERILPEYALLYLLSPKGVEALQLASPGGAGRNRTLSQTEFLKISIPLPSVAEQRMIVNLVQIADREIDLLRQELDLLKQQKKGLMQKLLTGQVRVKLRKGAS